MVQPQPKWSYEAANLAKETSEEFHENIRRVAVRLARHECNSYVDPRNVKEAVDCLKRSGLNRVLWYTRPELEVGFGVALIPFSVSMPDVVSAIKELVKIPEGFGFFFMAVGLFFAAAVVIHGWVRGML